MCSIVIVSLLWRVWGGVCVVSFWRCDCGRFATCDCGLVMCGNSCSVIVGVFEPVIVGLL